jgi:mRNA-degrading endonuclease RelE of RelBE toxin-antitoxin system
MTAGRYDVEFTETAAKAVRGIKDVRVCARLIERAEKLAVAPVILGKELFGEFRGLRSLRAGRYRIIYKIDEAEKRVIIVTVCIRKEGDKKDIYEVLAKLVKGKLLGD